jgi:outer membrane receptor protein involved in Fe transport
LRTQPTVDPTQVEEVGLDDTLLGEQAPEWVANMNASWMRGPMSATYRVRYQSPLSQFTAVEIARQPDVTNFLETDPLLVQDIQGSYSFENGLEAFFGVNNITNQKPDGPYLNLPVGPRGRVFYVGLSADFDNMTSLNPFK